MFMSPNQQLMVTSKEEKKKNKIKIEDLNFRNLAEGAKKID